MEREVINSIECAFWHKDFDVATEDLEWEHIEDMRETDEDASVHDYVISQKTDCPYCGKANNILATMKGTSIAQITSMKIITMERDALI